MQTIEHLTSLFEYDHWANVLTIHALNITPSQKSLSILAHLLITKQEYFDRLAGKDSTGFNFWPELNLEQCEQLSTSTNDAYRSLLANSNEDALERIASYKTSEGIPHRNSYRELFTHVLHHSSIHRGNIVLKMREEGLEPPKVDYILYLRSANGD